MHLIQSQLHPRWLAALVAVMAALGGCDGDDPPPPEEKPPLVDLVVETPENEETTRAEAIVVRGTVTAGSQVTVNSQRARIEPSPGSADTDRFARKVRLEPGRNVIRVEATRAGFRPAREEVAVNRPARLRLEIERPADGASTTKSTIAVVVRASEGSRVTVNGVRARLGDATSFVARIALELGENTIRARATRAGVDSVARTITVTRKRGCHPSYRGACIPPRADVDCTEISARDFEVVGDDPYGLDADGDGIACESGGGGGGGGGEPDDGGCHPAYEGACIPRGGDVDCTEIPEQDFASIGSDPYRLDADGDGVACES